ncbi:MAG: enoyl-CoA hydratase/isomerase family protein [Acidobacteria bacterium]|nr:enoyl-CoA hydratase/isomerase family protein [Acidobacteriota bacterium]
MAEEPMVKESTEDYSMKPAELMPADFKFIKHRIEGPVVRMTLDRPDKNLLNEHVLLEIARGIEILHERDEVKLIVLDAAGQYFCGGVELAEYTAQRVFQMLEVFHRVFNAMMDVAKPVITVVNGPAVAGGSELAAFGDIVIGTPKAKFAQPEITIGVFPPLAATIFPYILGPKRALELVLTGQPISAERAHELGLITRLVPEDKLQETVNDLISKITSQSGAVLSMAKRAIYGGVGLSLKAGLKNSMNVFLHELYKLEDSQEGLRAVVEKRKPQWKNR